jgi:hypothetical protein
MIKYGHIAWRVAAVVMAFAGTAALAVTLTRAPISPQAALSSNVICPTSGLQAWLGLGSTATPATGPGASAAGIQAAGGTYYTLEFTNVSHRACSLYGYPEVAAYAVSQIGGAAVHDTSIRPQSVTLQPGATAHSVLRVADAAGSQPAACVQVIAQELRVTLPDQQGRASYVPVHIPVCAQNGHVSLSVQAIQARPGIPGYTMP